jgi:hypothetical protein
VRPCNSGPLHETYRGLGFGVQNVGGRCRV